MLRFTRLLSAGRWLATVLLIGGLAGQTSAALLSDRTQITVTCAQGENASSQSLVVWHDGDEYTYESLTATTSAGWINVSPSQGQCAGRSDIGLTVSVEFESSGLAPGTHQSIIYLSQTNAPDALSIPVELRVTGSGAVIAASPDVLRLEAVHLQTTSLSTLLEVWNGAGSGAVNMNYSLNVTVGQNWMYLSDPTGASQGAHNRHVVDFFNLKSLGIGSYTGVIEVTTFGAASNDPLDVPVILDVVHPPVQFRTSPSNHQQMVMWGSDASPMSFDVSGYAWQAPFVVEPMASWLRCAPAQGVTGGEGTTRVWTYFDTTALRPGIHQGTIAIYNTKESEPTALVRVELEVQSHSDPIALGGPPVEATLTPGSGTIQTFWIANANTGGYSYTAFPFTEDPMADWLTVPADSGTTDEHGTYHQVGLSAASIAEGSHTGSVSVFIDQAPAYNSPLDVPVIMHVASVLDAAPTVISNRVGVGQPLASTTLTISNLGSTNPVPFRLVCEGDWFSASETTGVVSTTAVEIQVDFQAGLERGFYQGAITVHGVHQSIGVPLYLAVDDTLGSFEETILFMSRGPEERNDVGIWAMRPDGSLLRRLLFEEDDWVDSFAVSPDGKHLLFGRRRSDAHVVWSLETGAKTVLFEKPPYIESAIWSADGQSVLVSTDGDNSSVYRYALDGQRTFLFQNRGSISLLGTDPASGDIFYARSLGKFFVQSQSEFCAYRAATGTHDVLAPSPKISTPHSGEFFPGKRLLCFSLGGMLEGQTYTLDVDSGEITLLSESDVHDHAFPNFSPDGDRVVATVSMSGDDSPMSILNHAGGTEEQLLAGSGLAPGYASWCYLYQMLPLLSVSESELHFNVLQKSSDVVTATFDVRNSGTSFLTYSVTNETPWLWTDIVSGTSTGESDRVTVHVNPSGLLWGTHSGAVSVACDQLGVVSNIIVHLDVTPIPSVLSCEDEISASVERGDSGLQVHVPVWNAGGGSMRWDATVDQPWMERLLWAGTAADEVDHARLMLRHDGLADGLHTGLVTFTVQRTTLTKNTRIVLEVSTPAPKVPDLVVSPVELSVTAPRGMAPPDQTLAVRNDGAGLIRYDTTSNQDWLRIYPNLAGSAARHSVTPVNSRQHRVRFLTDGKPEGVHRATLTLTSEDRTIDVPVTCTIGPANRYGLNVSSDPGGSISLIPSAPGDRYEHGTVVRVRCGTSSGYRFSHWEGPAPNTGASSIDVTMTTNVTLHAVIEQRAQVSGRVTDFEDNPLARATVRIGTHTLTTDANGDYQFIMWETGQFACRASKPGYKETQWQFVDAPGGSQTLDFTLYPRDITNIEVVKWGAENYVILYDLPGAAWDTVRVIASASGDDGRTWSLPMNTVVGDIGEGVHPGTKRSMIWVAKDDWPNRETEHARIRIRTPRGNMGVSDPFPLRTVVANRLFLRAFVDCGSTSNRRFDGGETLHDVEVYLNGRTPSHFIGRTDSAGVLLSPHAVGVGDQLFLRKKIYEQPTERNEHETVGNLIYTLWMDSDVGGTDTDPDWDGIWTPRTLTHEDIARLDSGWWLDIGLHHALFEWHMTIDVINTFESFSEIVSGQMPTASKYLYRVTNGHMKLGDLHIRNRAYEFDFATHHTDVRVDPWCKVCNASVGTMLKNPPPEADWRIQMDQATLVVTPYANTWARTLIHELGHYAFDFSDEYRVYSQRPEGDTFGWKRRYPELFQQNYGFMDGQQSSLTMSSSHDYISNAEDYVPAAFEPTLTMKQRLAQWLPMQVYIHDIKANGAMQPCWTHFQKQFEKTYPHPSSSAFPGRTLDVRVELISPVPGVFKDGEPTTKDRRSTYFIPAPYDACRVRINDHAWQAKAFQPTGKRVAELKNGRVDVIVSRGGRPEAGAVVVLRRSDGNLIPQVCTSSTGLRPVLGVCSGDTLEVYCRGAKRKQKVTRDTLGGTLAFAFDAPAGDDAMSSPVPRLANGELRMAISPSFMPYDPIMPGSGDLWLSLEPNMDLATNATVTIHFGSASNLVLTATTNGFGAYEVYAPIGSNRVADVEVTAVATNGSSFSTLDAIEIIPYSPTGMRADVPVEPSAELGMMASDGLVYLARGPVPLPVTNLPLTQVGYAVAYSPVGMGTFPATVTIDYSDAEVAGLDETTLAMYQWIMGGGWERVSGGADIERNLVRASVSWQGPCALFAQASADTVAPNPIVDLNAVPGDRMGSVVLGWTASGDDGTNGAATAYRLGFSEGPFTNVEEATAFLLGIVPAAAGQGESAEILLPLPDTLYYLSLLACDEAGNCSPTGNLITVWSGLDDENGDGISDQWLGAASSAAGTDISAESDLDGDGLTAREEYRLNTNPNAGDTDGDGMNDGYEAEHGLDPLDATDADGDADGDGLTNLEEHDLVTSAALADTDGDGIPDRWELLRGLDPRTASGSYGADANPDGDPMVNIEEYVADTDPTNAASYFRIESFSNGTPFRLRFFSSADRLYTLYGTSNLTSGAWQTVPGQSGVRGNGGWDRLEDAAPRRSGAYRLGVEVP